MINFIKKNARVAVSIKIVVVIFILGGCGNYKFKKVSSKEKVSGMKTPLTKEQEVGNFKQCARQLEILKDYDPEKYKSYKSNFDHLMQGAAHYSRIRNEINTGIQDTVDALYHYKGNILCAEVNHETLRVLVELGERLK